MELNRQFKTDYSEDTIRKLYNDVILDYADKNKIIDIEYRGVKTIVITINKFALLTGFTLTLDTRVEYQKFIDRDSVSGKLYINTRVVKNTLVINKYFAPLFNYTSIYNVDGFEILFNLIDEHKYLIVNIPAPDDIKPFILFAKYNNFKQSSLDERACYNEDYEDDLLHKLKIVITFNGQIIMHPVPRYDASNIFSKEELPRYDEYNDNSIIEQNGAIGTSCPFCEEYDEDI